MSMSTPTSARGFWKPLTTTFDAALTAVPAALKEEGFGIITEIDMQATLKAKLGVEFRRYRILGACNPKFAKQALDQDPQIGMLLPCNVVLYEKDDGSVMLGMIDPIEQLGGGSGAAVDALAKDVRSGLERAMKKVS